MVDGMTAVQITVRGSHTVRLLPERATVHAALAAEGPAPQPVFDAVVAALADVKTSIEALHDPKRGPVTWYSFDQVRMGSRRPWNKDGKQLPLVHSAMVSVAAKFSDFDDLATWVTWSAGVDGFGIGYIEWALTEDRRLKVERRTRQRALRDAKSRAQDYADALELGVVTVLGVDRFQFVQRVDQGFGDESAAVGAEMPAGIGLGVVQHGSGLVVRRASGGGPAGRSLASRTAWQNRRISAASLTPLLTSTPELTSTAQGRTRVMPSITLAGLNPPDKTSGRRTLSATPCSMDQSNTFPAPP
jgi:hypothetical protein